MTAEGRLARGEANHKAGKYLKNPETLAYLASLPNVVNLNNEVMKTPGYPKDIDAKKPKGVKNAKPTK